MLKWIFIMTSFLLLGACSGESKEQSLDICNIFQHHPAWYWSSKTAEEKWGVPVSVQMAIIHKESNFRDNDKPHHEKLLGFIPWSRHETVVIEYSPSLNNIWNTYIKETGQKNASRSSFANATDFVGWFAARAERDAGISKADAYALSLAYHEGLQGYHSHTLAQGRWLIFMAKKTQRMAENYQEQLVECRDQLPKKHWWSFLVP